MDRGIKMESKAAVKEKWTIGDLYRWAVKNDLECAPLIMYTNEPSMEISKVHKATSLYNQNNELHVLLQ